jgi:hypothetical protein
MTRALLVFFVLLGGLAAGTIDVSNDDWVTVETGDLLSFHAGARVSGPGYLYFAAGGLTPAEAAPAARPGSTEPYFPGFRFAVTVESFEPLRTLEAGDRPLVAGFRSSHGYSGSIGAVSVLQWLSEPGGWSVVRLRNLGEPFTFGYPGYKLKHAFDLALPGGPFAPGAAGGQRRVEWAHVPEPGTALLFIIGLALLAARLLFFASDLPVGKRRADTADADVEEVGNV